MPPSRLQLGSNYSGRCMWRSKQGLHLIGCYERGDRLDGHRSPVASHLASETASAPEAGCLVHVHHGYIVSLSTWKLKRHTISLY